MKNNLPNSHIFSLEDENGGNSLDPSGFIRLDLSEFPYPPSPKVVKAICDSAFTINRYPDSYTSEILIETIANYAGVSRDEIFIGNGSDDLIELIVKTFVTLNQEVVIPVPSFYMYEHATKVVGGVPVFVPRTSDFGISVNKVLDKVTSKTKVLFIANPNNPTANLIPRSIIQEVLEKTDCIVVLDECYYEICQETCADLVQNFENIIILRSMSKGFGIAGLRFGYGIANPAMCKYLRRTAQPFSVNKLARVAALAAFSDLEYTYTHLEIIRSDRKKLVQALEAQRFKVYPSQTNFLFVGTRGLNFPSPKLVAALRQRKVLVRDFGQYPELGPYFFRTSVGTAEENLALLEALEDILVAN